MEKTPQNRLDIQRAYNRKYAQAYRERNPEKKRANDLRYYARKLIAAGYIVQEPTTTGTPARLAI